MTTAHVVVYFAAAFGGLAVPLVAAWMRRGQMLRRAVFDNLDSAAQNGYFEVGEHLQNENPAGIAADMVLYGADFEDMKPSRLEPHVRAWMISRGLL